MKKVIDLVERITGNFKPRDKEHIAEFLPIYEMVNEDSIAVLAKYNVELTRNSQVIALTQDAKTLTQTLDLATKMNFIDAYKENPKRLTLLVSDVIKRMAKCDAIGVPYKTDKGYASFLFSSRLFKEMTDKLTEDQKRIIATPKDEEAKEMPDANPLVKELLDAIIAKFDFTEEGISNIYAKLDEVLKTNDNLSTKEILLSTLQSSCSADPSFLEKAIDEAMLEVENKEENDSVTFGRRAA